MKGGNNDLLIESYNHYKSKIMALNHEFILVTNEEVENVKIRPFWRDYGVLNQDYTVIHDRYIVNQLSFQLGYCSYEVRGIGLSSMEFCDKDTMINYWGANLILCKDLDDYISVLKTLKPKKEFNSLIQLCEKAKELNMHVVHFGV